jgi:hypothetical protein
MFEASKQSVQARLEVLSAPASLPDTALRIIDGLLLAVFLRSTFCQNATLVPLIRRGDAIIHVRLILLKLGVGRRKAYERTLELR